jgi:hypothetical protein
VHALELALRPGLGPGKTGELRGRIPIASRPTATRANEVTTIMLTIRQWIRERVGDPGPHSPLETSPTVSGTVESRV